MRTIFMTALGVALLWPHDALAQEGATESEPQSAGTAAAAETGTDLEVASITLEQVKYASADIQNAVEKRLISQQEAARQKAAIEATAAREMRLLATRLRLGPGGRLNAEGIARNKAAAATPPKKTARKRKAPKPGEFDPLDLIAIPDGWDREAFKARLRGMGDA